MPQVGLEIATTLTVRESTAPLTRVPWLPGSGNQGKGPIGQATVPVTELPDFVTWYVTVLPL